MDKLHNIFILIPLCLFALPAMGQKDLDETIRRNVELEKEISGLAVDSAKTEARLKDLLSAIQEDSLLLKSLDEEYLQATQSVSSDTISELSRQISELEKREQSLKAGLQAKTAELARKDKTLSSSRAELGGLEAYMGVQQERMYSSYKEYLSRKFSSMSDEKLEEIQSTADDFQGMNDAADYKKRVQATLSNRQIYKRAWAALNTAYRPDSVEAMKSLVGSMLDVKKDNSAKGQYKLSEEQYSEMDSVIVKLRRYKNGVNELKKLVETINADEDIVRLRQEKTKSNKKDCLTKINHYLFPEPGSDGDRVASRYFKTIPYLWKLINDYWRELKQNPFETPTPSETKIMNMITE